MSVTRMPTVDNPGTVAVRVSKSEYLHFSVTAGGPIPIFTFVARNNKRQASDLPGHPQTLYQWDHLKDQSQQEQLGLAAITFSFFSNKQYQYKVQVFDEEGNALKTAMDIRFTGDPTDQAPESFNVMLT